MAQQNSFDIVSQVDRAEVTNAIHQTVKEVRQRFDFKGSNANVALEENDLVLSAEDETKLRNMNDIFQQKLVRRGVPLKALSYGTVEPAAGGTVRQRVQIQQGIPQEKAKDIVKFIKRFEGEGAGIDSGRHRAGVGQRPRYAATSYRRIESERLWHQY